MVDRPIIFSAPMVRALLDRRKTMTRRLVKRGPVRIWLDSGFTHGFINDPGNASVLPYQSGDRLWVREAHAILPRTAYRASIGTGTIDQMEHPTDGYSAAVFREGFDRSGRPLWKPSIHMPRWASRLTLTVTAVRVEPLQSISLADIEAEGAIPPGPCVPAGDALPIWIALWDSLHGDGAWDANPDVVAISFRVERRNIDAPRLPPPGED